MSQWVSRAGGLTDVAARLPPGDKGDILPLPGKGDGDLHAHMASPDDDDPITRRNTAADDIVGLDHIFPICAAHRKACGGCPRSDDDRVGMALLSPDG